MFYFVSVVAVSSHLKLSGQQRLLETAGVIKRAVSTPSRETRRAEHLEKGDLQHVKPQTPFQRNRGFVLVNAAYEPFANPIQIAR